MKAVFASVAALALLPAVGESAEPPPDEEFLEYLAEFEAVSDDWTWFADDEAATSKDVKPPLTPPAKEVKK